MNSILATVGVLMVGGGLSICDLCGSDGTVGGAPLASVAQAATVSPALTLKPALVKKTAILKIQGMTCGGCVLGVRKVLTRIPGVTKADVSYKQSRAVVTYDPATATVDQMTAAIKTLGYKATVVALGAPK